MKKPKLFANTSSLSAVLLAAMLFLGGVLIASAVKQFSSGQWFSGCVSILGTFLVLLVGAIQISDLRKKNLKKREEDHHEHR